MSVLVGVWRVERLQFIRQRVNDVDEKSKVSLQHQYNEAHGARLRTGIILYRKPLDS